MIRCGFFNRLPSIFLPAPLLIPTDLSRLVDRTESCQRPRKASPRSYVELSERWLASRSYSTTTIATTVRAIAILALPLRSADFVTNLQTNKSLLPPLLFFLILSSFFLSSSSPLLLFLHLLLLVILVLLVLLLVLLLVPVLAKFLRTNGVDIRR